MGAPFNPAHEPVSDYGGALRWLVTHERVEEWAFDANIQPPKSALLVCDMFWLTIAQLRRDLVRLYDIPRSVSEGVPRLAKTWPLELSREVRHGR